MYVRIGADLSFRLIGPTPMLLMLYTHPTRSETLLSPEVLHTYPPLPIETFIDGFGNRCARIAPDSGNLRIWTESVVQDDGIPDSPIEGYDQAAVEDLPPETLQFLLSSRYCEVDVLADQAWQLFGHLPSGWRRVQGICDWVHQNVEFGYQFASKTKTAQNVLQERRGVCRDFQHLAITFCRCLNVPARYATGYLGDIGVPIDPNPGDFSAWFEVYLGGKWHTMDARHNMPRIARVLMARGRDATDVALTTSFGPAELTGFKVWTDELPGYSPPASPTIALPPWVEAHNSEADELHSAAT